MFPTGVGMNRHKGIPHGSFLNVPHGRGDEPLSAVSKVYNGDMIR
jgi:hypothetical protein